MKQINLITLGVLVILLGFIFGIATIKVTSKYRFKKSASEMLGMVTTDKHKITFNEASGLILDANTVFVDIRTPKEYDGFHIQNAINIPYERLLDDEFANLFKRDQAKILYGNTSVTANAAWMILTQFGYENLYVLDGNIDNLSTHAQNTDIFKDSPKNDGVALFDYGEIMNKK
jgi:rhodanese-related sulfurtransferase